jgi:hypothetical protein
VKHIAQTQDKYEVIWKIGSKMGDILKWILKKLVAKGWTGLKWSRTGSNGGLLITTMNFFTSHLTMVARIWNTWAEWWVGVHDADTPTTVAVHGLPLRNTGWSYSSSLSLYVTAWWPAAGTGLLHVSHNTCCSPLPRLLPHALAPCGHLEVLLSSPKRRLISCIGVLFQRDSGHMHLNVCCK